VSRYRAVAGVLALCALLALGGCTDVPTSSSPQVIKTLGLAQPQQPAVSTPQPGADPRSIVNGFLMNNASADQHHLAARAFLTPEAKNRWSDAGPTTIVDRVQIGNVVDNTVTVRGNAIGTIDQSGAYTPSLQGDGTGTGSSPVTETVELKLVDKQWRIDRLQNGLLISASQFAQYYTQRLIYFYDQTEQQLVPEVRYSPLTDPDLLATWLMTQLVSQPNPALSTNLPSVPSVSQIKVNLGAALIVDLPGANQLDKATKDRMAAQVALTLDQAATSLTMQITDGGQPVKIPQLGDSTFTRAQFAYQLSPANQSPTLFFVNDGGIYDGSGKPLSGAIGTSTYALRSAALASSANTSHMLVAGTSGSATDARLLVGQSGGTLRETAVHGALSRPAWAPESDEVWVGNGMTLVRVSANGTAQAVPITATSGTVRGKILAVRFSPEGSRVGLVIRSSQSESQIWIGSVVRSPDSVRVVGLYAISPAGVAITDVGWNDQTKLFAIGREVSTGDPSIYEVQCDGSHWDPRGIGNLPQAPDSITVAENVVPAVSAGETVWVQRAGTWVSPDEGTTSGTNPVYLE
jgi:hypothetical protein